MNAVSYTLTAGAVSSAIAPSRAVATVRPFRVGAYTQGDLFRASNGLHYIVLASATYATEPAHRTGAVANLLATAHKQRRAIVLYNDGAATAYIGFSGAAATDTGIPIVAGASLSLAWIQAGVSAITESDTAAMRVAEIFE